MSLISLCFHARDSRKVRMKALERFKTDQGHQFKVWSNVYARLSGR